jgi:hypothetical protein
LFELALRCCKDGSGRKRAKYNWPHHFEYFSLHSSSEVRVTRLQIGQAHESTVNGTCEHRWRLQTRYPFENSAEA